MSKRKLSSVNEPSSCKRKCTHQAKLTRFFSEGSEASGSKQGTVAIPQDFGIHVYTAREIKLVKGLAQDYRKFWNSKAHEICKDKRVTSRMDEKSIKGAINSSWTIHKSNLLLHQARQLEEKPKTVWCDEAARTHRLKPIVRNMERIKMADANLKQLYDELHALTSVAGRKDKELEMEQAMTELKKAQDALQKALDRKKEDLEMDEKRIHDDHAAMQITNSPQLLSDSELQGLVEAIKIDQVDQDCQFTDDSDGEL